MSVYSERERETEKERGTLKRRKFEEEVCSVKIAFVLTVCVTKYCVNRLWSVNDSPLCHSEGFLHRY